MNDQPESTPAPSWQARLQPLLGRSLSVRQLFKGAGLLLLAWLVLSLTILPGEPKSAAFRNMDAYYAPTASPVPAAKSAMPADQVARLSERSSGLATANMPRDRVGGPNLAEEVIQNSTTGGAIAKAARG